MSQKEPGHPDLNRREKHIMEMILTAKSEMRGGGECLKARLKSADPRAWMYFRTACGLLDKVQGILYSTMPRRQLLQVKATCQSGCVSLTANPALTPKGYTCVSDLDLNTVLAAAVNNKCAYCLDNDLESSGCELRKALMALWPPVDLNRYGCPYQGQQWMTPTDAEGGNEDE